MFEEILQQVKAHFAENPEVAAAIPADKMEAIHQEIATHVTNGVSSQPAAAQGGLGGLAGGFGGILEKLEGSVASGGAVTSAIEGGLVSSLAAKFGLSPAITGAIAGALPGILQKFAAKKIEGQV